MIENFIGNNGEKVISFRCENCESETSGTVFSDLLDEIKTDGWKFNHVGDYWEHFCKDCSSRDLAY